MNALRPIAAATAFALAVPLVGCTADAPAATGPPRTSHTIVGVDNEWKPAAMVVPVGEQVEIEIENKDRGVAHNFRLLAPGAPKTKVEVGPVTQEIRVELDRAGSYEFVCDIHPQMRGTVRAVRAE